MYNTWKYIKWYLPEIFVCTVIFVCAIAWFYVYTTEIPHKKEMYKEEFTQACMKVENNTDICNYEYLKTQN